MPASDSTASITRCRSVLDRATTRAHMSPAPVMVNASSTSGMLRQVPRDRLVAGALPDLQGQERGDRVAQRLRLELGPHPEITPPAASLSSRACTVPARDAEPAGRLEDPDPRLVGEQMEQSGIQIVHDGSSDWAGCTVFRRTVAQSVRSDHAAGHDRLDRPTP